MAILVITNKFMIETAVRTFKRLVRETAEVSEIPGELLNLRKEYDSLKAFLGDAEEKQEGDSVVRKWMRDVRELAYEAEVITEKHSDRIKRHRDQLQPGCWNALIRGPHDLFDGLAMTEESSQIHMLSHKMAEMRCKMSGYGIESRPTAADQSTTDDPAAAINANITDLLDERMVVGLDKDIKAIGEQLVSAGSTAKVVSICGVDGLGKTTLAKEVIKSKRVVDHFDAIAWAYVGPEGPDFRVQDVLRNILSQLTAPEDVDNNDTNNDINHNINTNDINDGNEISHMGEDVLSARISGILVEKRCLVVLDDFQAPTAWHDFRAAFSGWLQSTASSSKLVLTTPDPAVLSCVDPRGSHHHLRFLNPEERWELFLKTAGSSGKGFGGFMLKLMKMPVITNHYVGLPLTIHLLGGHWKYNSSTLLAAEFIPALFTFLTIQGISKLHFYQRKKDSKLHNDFGGAHRRSGDENNMSAVEMEAENVLLTVDDMLQSRLRLCLLEMVEYPAGLAIPTQDLFSKWIDRAIIKPKNPRSKADKLAQKCLAKLVAKSLVQVIDMDGERIKSCQLHRVVRDFYIRLNPPSHPLFRFAKSLKEFLGVPTTKGPALVSL